MLQTFLYSWPDLLWLLMILLVLHKGQRLIAIGFVLSGMLMLRLQVELMQEIGYPNGILNILNNDLFHRGLITYSAFYLFYILIMYFSPGSLKSVKVAASISIFFVALCVSTGIMAL